MDRNGAALMQSSKRNWSAAALWLLPLIYLGLFFFYPLAAVLRLVVQGSTTAFNAVTVLRPLGFTIYQAALSTVLTLLVGIPAAGMFARFEFPGKRFLRALTTLPFILPTVVVAAAFNALIGPNGWLNQGLMAVFQLTEPPIQLLNTLPAILIAHVFYNTTVVIRLVGSAWTQLDPRLGQAARVLGAAPLRAFREVTFPLLRPSILAAALLVFLFDFTSFGVILMLGGPRFSTLEVEIYLQAVQMLNLPLAALLSTIQLGCTLGLAILSNRLSGQKYIPLTPRLKGEGTSRPEGVGQKAALVGLGLLLLSLLVLPLMALAARSVIIHDTGGTRLTLDFFSELFINRRQSLFYVPPVVAARNSLVYALATVGLSLAVGVPASAALNRRGGFTRVMDAALMLPLGASAVTLGLGFLIVFNQPPLDVSSSPWLIPVAHSLVALPLVVRTVQPAMASIPENLRQSAALLGAQPLRVWWEVDRPIITRAVLVSAIFAFTISLGEFGATSFLSRPDMPTLPVAIYSFLSQPGAFNYGQAMAMATVLLAVCGCSIVLMERLGD